MSKALTTQQPQALATRQMSEALSQFQDETKFHLLGPKTHLGEIPAGVSLSIRELKVDAKDGSQVYGVGGGKTALSGTVLDKMAGASGATTVHSKRVDGRTHPHYCEFEVRMRVIDLDGTVREEVGTKTIDLRDDAGGGEPGKDQKAMTTARQLGEARKFITEICASKAKNRAVAHLLGVKRSYDARELDKPFIIPKLVPDAHDPASKQAVLANVLGASTALYGAPPPPPPVVDATFEEEPQPASPPAAGNGEGVGDSAPAKASDSPAPDTAAPTGTAEVIKIITTAWHLACDGGIGNDAFIKICRSQTGVAAKEEMTAEHAHSVVKAVEAYISNSDANEQLPV